MHLGPITFVVALVVLLAVAPALAQPAAGPPLPFPVTQSTLWLSATSGSVPGVDGAVPLLSAAAPTASAPAQVLMVPVLEQLGVSAHAASWYGLTSWNATTQFATDPVVQLHFFLGVQATTTLRVRLEDVSPDGAVTLLAAADQRLSIQNILPFVADAHLVPTGAHLARGHNLRLTVLVEDIDVLTWLHYDATTTPAHLVLATQVVDSDADGIPDDVDECPLEADCDGDAVIDGDEIAYHNGTGDAVTYHQHYYAYGQPGSSGQPGDPGQAGPSAQPGGPGDGSGEPGSGPGNPFPQPGTGGSGSEDGLSHMGNIELGAGVAMGAGSLLLALGGLFGRHPL